MVTADRPPTPYVLIRCTPPLEHHPDQCYWSLHIVGSGGTCEIHPGRLGYLSEITLAINKGARHLAEALECPIVVEEADRQPFR